MTDLLRNLALLQDLKRRRTYRAFDFFEPYKKQIEFFDLGVTKTERMFTAGNQLGKTHPGAFEATCHLTGEYPEWWMGRRWDRPTRGWLCGETSLATRDTIQKKLCGEPGVNDAFGTGMIPRDAFADKPSLARGVTDAYDTIQVKHKSGGISVGRFKSYEQGRTKFQGETLDFIWDDEECPMEIYSEQLARITATNGMIYTTFTSLKGATSIVERFMSENSIDRAYVTMTIDDVIGEPHGHIKKEDRAKIIAKYQPWEVDARVFGGILRGEGRVFRHLEALISEEAISNIPPHWRKIWGIDFGINHPFAAVLLAWDVDLDVIHVVATVRMKDALPIIHAAAMKPIGAGVPVAWPQDGTQRRDDGKPLSSQYKTHGLHMLDEHATHADGSISTEAGIMEMDARMATGRLKIAAHLADWWEEYRNYHRKDGLIVKEKDDLMSATRIGVMMRRRALAIPLGAHGRNRKRAEFATGVDTDPLDV